MRSYRTQPTQARRGPTPGERWRRNLADVRRRFAALASDPRFRQYAAAWPPAERAEYLNQLREFSDRCGRHAAEGGAA